MKKWKRQYIAPEAEVFECKVNAMLMGSILDPLEDVQDIIPTDDINPGEFGGHEFDFQIDDEDDKSFFGL